MIRSGWAASRRFRRRAPPGAGVVIDWAYQQAAADINADCGIDIATASTIGIEVLTGDSEGISERGQALAERWIFEDGVHGVVGGYHSAVALATMKITQENQHPDSCSPVPGTTISPPMASSNTRAGGRG